MSSIVCIGSEMTTDSDSRDWFNMTRLRNWCRLLRLDSAPLSMGAPVLGALAQNSHLLLWQFVVLGLVGLCAHIFGFVLNDVVDWELDRTNPVNRDRPLVRGFVPRKIAAVGAGFRIPLALLLSMTLPYITLSTCLLLLVAFGLAAIYDLFGKKLPTLVVATDFSLGASEGILLVWGAATAAGSINQLVILMGIYLSLQMTLVNMLMSFKDLKYDIEFGVRTSIIWLGVRVDAQGNPVVSVAMRLCSLVLATSAMAVYVATLLFGLWNMSMRAVCVVSLLGVLASGVALVALFLFLWVSPRQLYAQLYFDLMCLVLLMPLGAHVGVRPMAYLLVLLLVPFLITLPYKAAAFLTRYHCKIRGGR